MKIICPLCLGSLKVVNVNEEETESRYCMFCYDQAASIAKFSYSYQKTNEQLITYILYLDDYCIENSYDLNRTKISVLDKAAPYFKHNNLLFLPLIHFENDNLAKIKQKLKLLITFS